MSIHLDHAALLEAVAGLRSTADRLRAQQQSACRSVDTLVDGGWSGGAARCYREAWEQWADGSGQVVAALSTLADLVAAARLDLVERDGEAALDLARLGPPDTDAGAP